MRLREVYVNLLVTGADGFVGRALCPVLAAAGHRVRRAVRVLSGITSPDTIAIGDLGGSPDWANALAGIEVVVHLAGRAHVMREAGPVDAAAAYRQTNVVGTEQLARAAVAVGVRRLVFVSSIKVNGEATRETPFRETDPPRPEDDYGRSKWAAEQALTTIARETGLQIVIVRPPLIYGPGVKGNLARLMRFVDRGIPLPFGGIENRRSMIGLGNLCTALRACAEHPGAAGETFLVSDGSDLSTPGLIRALAAGLGRPGRLVAVPTLMLRCVAQVTRSGALARLIGSLAIDSARIREHLGWQPRITVEQEIAAMVRAYRAQTNCRSS